MRATIHLLLIKNSSPVLLRPVFLMDTACKVPMKSSQRFNLDAVEFGSTLTELGASPLEVICEWSIYTSCSITLLALEV